MKPLPLHSTLLPINQSKNFHSNFRDVLSLNMCPKAFRCPTCAPEALDPLRGNAYQITVVAHCLPTVQFPAESLPGQPAERARLALCMLGLELGLSHGARCHLGLYILLLALVWFPRVYLHYCGQWLLLHAIAAPISRFQFHLHTVELVYQNSLLHTREELAVVVVGPLTLNVATLLLVLIRWGCQLTFGSVPSFLSKFIMALGVWTVFDPLAVFAVDAVLGRLTYSAQRPIADAAKLAWHFHRTQHSHLPGILITLFLYTVLLFCSLTILYIYFLRFHNDGCLLDVFQRLHGMEGSFFIPQDLEVSNQELSYILSKAEQWRGFGGERRKVAVYDYVWTEDTPSHHDTSSSHPPHGSRPPSTSPPRGQTSTHVAIYTLHPSGFREAHRHFLRQPSGAIVEVHLPQLVSNPPTWSPPTCASAEHNEKKKTPVIKLV
uniref:Uncharacterized protein n=1 Tax=Scleropages formosus TaxID=113540 RepID=A0A8C9RLC4_SCLFO